MTDRVFGFHVLLDKEYRTDDVEAIVDAVKMIKGVRTINIHISNVNKWAANRTARLDVAEKLINLHRELVSN